MLILILLTSIGFLVSILLIVLAVRSLIARGRSHASRGLFRFHDGKKTREIDPIQVLISLEEHPKFRIDLDPRRALQDGDRESLANMADAVRTAFIVPKFSVPGRPGLTTYECVELLAVFMLYVDMQKKSTNPPPTSQPSTESTSTASDASTTPSMLDSGSSVSEALPSTP
ncbi:hypothetical protein [Aureliella helgolandensis]|uniref:Uncharacterized protein n=1 Tax=Aureliella helgolandensis TaxID=2527968 RepID=A0A518GCM3_9BACT|nr:hypothetical protein [Aureliella helgolandensis]QDV26352.1 hypothetical protein Q31a_47250 [Aureliella helgolandensis]